MSKRNSESDSNNMELVEDMYENLDTSPKTKFARMEERTGSSNDLNLETLNMNPISQIENWASSMHLTTSTNLETMADLQKNERKSQNGQVTVKGEMMDEEESESDISMTNSTNFHEYDDDCTAVCLIGEHELFANILSPTSSSSSTENVCQFIKSRRSSSMQNRLSQINQTSLLPESTRDMLRKCLQNKNFVERLRGLMEHDFKSQMLSSGLELESNECSSLIKFLQTSDRAMLCNVVGHTYVTEIIGTQNQDGSSDTLGEQPSTGVNDVSGDTKSLKVENRNVKLNANDNLSQIDSADHSVSASTDVIVIVTPLPSVEIQPRTPTPPPVVPNFALSNIVPDTNELPDVRISISTDDWERAFDHVSNKDSKARVKKMGMVLFDAVFTNDEIRDSTVSAKKGKKHFDANKCRFIRNALLWLKTEPKVRTQEAFERRQVKKHDKSDEADLSYLKTSVFTEYAYSRRSKLKLLQSQT